MPWLLITGSAHEQPPGRLAQVGPDSDPNRPQTIPTTSIHSYVIVFRDHQLIKEERDRAPITNGAIFHTDSQLPV